MGTWPSTFPEKTAIKPVGIFRKSMRHISTQAASDINTGGRVHLSVLNPCLLSFAIPHHKITSDPRQVQRGYNEAHETYGDEKDVSEVVGRID